MIGHQSIKHFPVILLMLVLVSGCNFQSTTIPGTSIVLNGSPLSSSSISLSWEDNSTNEDGFSLERSLHGTSAFQVIAEVGANATSYVDSGLEPDTAYYYRI